MKLKDILEVNFQSIDQYEPSGVSTPTTLDPDKVDDLKRKRNVSRNERSRRKWRILKRMRSPESSRVSTVSDNTDLTGSGAHSVVNGPFKY